MDGMGWDWIGWGMEVYEYTSLFLQNACHVDGCDE